MRYASNWTFTFDSKHGFGILFHQDRSNDTFQQCFFENGELVSGENIAVHDSIINALDRYASDDWSIQRNAKAKATYEGIMAEGQCAFQVEKDASLTAILTTKKSTFTVKVSSDRRSFYYDVDCTCKDRSCIHKKAAANFLQRRLAALQHQYVISDLGVDKTLFLEPELRRKTCNLEINDLDEALMQNIHEIVDLLDMSKSGDYYWKFHRFLLDLSYNYDYDARFLEDTYTELLLTLFENPMYQQAVLEPGTFADPEQYEDRQHRSNRASLKRVYKEYKIAVKEMDGKGDYSEHTYKEFLLKYREDWDGLLRYYARGKEKLERCDLPFLKKIAAQPQGDFQDLCLAASKVDGMGQTDETAEVIRLLAAGLPQEQRVILYSKLRNISMGAEEIQALSLEEQLKMIRNTPLTTDSFRHIMDDLLSDRDDVEKGHFILFVTQQIRWSKHPELKEAVISQTAKLANNRLLLQWVKNRLNKKTNHAPREGESERELSDYFDCGYEIYRDDRRLYATFTIQEPESNVILLQVREENGNLKFYTGFFDTAMGYDLNTIRAVCLKGKEEKYNEVFEKQKDALALAIFEQGNKKFAKEYKSLCHSLTEEKILYADAGKVGVEWLLYRQDGSNALAFKVGHGRMYIVKDATEFLRAFRTGETTKYGKDLILTHDTENLNEADTGIIKMLTTAKYSKGRKGESNNKRYITISDALMGQVLEGLAGRNVCFNDVPCELRMESRKVRLKISSKYVLSTDIRNHQEYFNLVGKGYLLEQPKKDEPAVLNRVEGSSDEMNLISLIDQNPAISIQPILKDFRKNIFARFFELFDVDSAVQRDFTLSQIRLNTYFDFDSGAISAKTVILRDEKEIRADQLTDRIDRVKIELLENFLSNLGFEDGMMTDESRVLAFFKMDFTRLKTLTNVYLSDSLRNKELKSIGKPVIRVTYQNNLASVFLERSEFSESELEQIIAGLRKKRKYILLSGDRIVDLDSDIARDFGETVDDFGMNPKDLYNQKVISMVNAIKAFSHERSCRVDKYLRDMIEEIRTFKESEIPVPELNAELRDYQVEGYRWLSILSKYGMGGILADDMGLGKTLQTIALIKSNEVSMPSLVVCPKSLIFNWISEFARFDGETEVKAIYGTDAQRSEIISGMDGKKKAVYITSYESLRNDITKYTGDFNYVILDEAQYIKNVHAQKTKSVKELKASHRFALTGTPIENSVVDLWSIFDFIMPGYFVELSRFRDTDTAAIARKSAPFILRRVKEDVLEDLPPKYERILSAEMSQGQRKLYDAMRQDARKALESGGKAFDMLPYLTRLRQVCVDPGMFVEDYHDGSGKMDMLTELIPEYLENHHRILIFSQFVKALESLRATLNQQGIPTYFLSGATPAKDRIEMMDSFNNGSGTDVFLISLKAGGTGLNLTGADTVIHLDPWWNVAAENQASDRTHRIGQTRNVEVIKLIAGESIEQRVVELQDIKKEVIRQVISDDDGSVTSASLEDIAFVLD